MLWLSSSSSSSSSSTILQGTLCFIAGSITAIGYMSLLSWYQTRSNPSHENDGDSCESFTSDHMKENDTTIRNVKSTTAATTTSTTRKEIPWPWDRMHKNRYNDNKNKLYSLSSRSSSSLTHDTRENIKDRETQPNPTDDNPLFQSTTSSSSVPSSPHNNLCIGSIFGFDIGGTLAKLVYFEENPQSRHYGNFSIPPPLPHRSVANFNDASTNGPQQQTLHTNNDNNDNNSLPHTTLKPRTRHSNNHRRQNTSDQALHRTTGKNATPTVADPAVNRSPGNTIPTTMNSPSLTDSPVRRTQSMLDFLTQREHRAQALDRFYAFARDNLNNNNNNNNSNARSTPLGSNNEPNQENDGNFYDIVRDQNLSFEGLDGTFHFLHFETRKMHRAVELIRRYELHQTVKSLGATGGGAHKFAPVFGQELGISILKLDELQCLVAGLQFVLSTVVGECYTYRPPQEYPTTPKRKKTNLRRGASFENHYGNYVGVEDENWSSVLPEEEELSDDGDNIGVASHVSPPTGTKLDEWWWSRKVPRDAISDASTYPYLLVTIGTGVSILRVDGPRRHERISGSTIGGGTYWGLIRLLTSVDNFSDVMSLAERGDPSKVDMMVGDIYGSNSKALDALGLREDLVASSFGKLVAKENPAEGLKEEDLARALLLMVTNNIGQVAYLNARLHKCTKIYFVGNFLRQNRLSQRRLSFAIDFWSKGNMEALFLEHEGYFGALGAFLLSQGISSSRQQVPSPNHHHHPASTTMAGGHHHHPFIFSSQQSMPVNIEESPSIPVPSSGASTSSGHSSSGIAKGFNRRSMTMDAIGTT